eukprot:TRINITY_DN11332_c0_g1_i1.p1 TRINITY_DN11332_c0_g1~~TRINITY_DN11332_c0_g1_i1.p1  ORF type:complete len:412 (-),score=109.80 TRINITY_DN11332_c0_g1_i1:164-1252(-)
MVGPRGSGKTLVLRYALKILGQRTQYDGKWEVLFLSGLASGENETNPISEDDLDNLKNNKKMGKSTFFILDDFDLFATRPKRQTVLYAFLDLLHSNEIQAIVVGLTCRIDVVELLEKRVKSRFAQKQINFFYLESPQQMIDALRNCLILRENEVEQEEDESMGEEDEEIQIKSEATHTQWNNSIEKLFADEKVISIISRHFNYTRNIRFFKTALQMALCRLDDDHPHLTAADVQWAIEKQTTDPKVEIVRGLPTLELGLMITMNKLQQDTQTCEFNFEQVFKMWNDFVKEKMSEMHLPKSVCFKAYEHLVEMELVFYYGSKTVQKQYRMARSMLFDAQIRDAIAESQLCPTVLEKWATQWVQ